MEIDIDHYKQLLHDTAPCQATIVAISKKQPDERVLQLYRAGHKVFGENRVQELVRKHDGFPKDIQWHMVGHLQRNKVKDIAPFITMIQSVDSVRLAREIDKQAEIAGRTIDCLLQVHIAREESKYGFAKDELTTELGKGILLSLKNIRIRGLMGMATFTDDTGQVREEFQQLKEYFDGLKEDFFSASVEFDTLSMGMSGDYQIALESGSTMIRIGSLLFGPRVYSSDQ